MSEFKLNLIAPVNDLGYGIHSRGIIKGLARLGYDNYHLRVIGERQGELSHEEVITLNRLAKVSWDRSAPCVKLWHEHDMEDLSGSHLIAYPVWETTRLFPQAINYLSQMDAVFVTSEWGKQVMAENIGDDSKIYVVNEAGQEFESKEDYEKFETFTFLHVGKFERRKCTLEIIKSYTDIFQSVKEDTRLIAHCYNPFDNNFVSNTYKALEQLGLELLPTATDPNKIIAFKGNAIVEIPKVKMKKEELFSLYKRAHVGIYPSRGEGWNLDLFESITNGMPCVASYVSAHTEYLREDLGYPKELLLVNGKEELAVDGRWFHGRRGNWVSPDFDELCDKIKYSYTNYDSIIESFDMTKIKHRFNWKNSAKQFVSALVEIVPDFNNLPVNLEIDN